MTPEEMDELVDRVSRNVYNIVLTLNWTVIQMSGDSEGDFKDPTYEQAIRGEFGS
jgi:hypothetical protein